MVSKPEKVWTTDLQRLSAQKFLVVLILLVPVAMVVALVTGTVTIPLREFFAALFDSHSQSHVILFQIRLPRILLALSVGLILASSGAVMQGLFRNPLADPSLIGVSSGASVGASLVIVSIAHFLPPGIHVDMPLIALGAFAGGFAATILVYRLATSEIGTSVATMLLAGIAISALSGAFNSLLSYVADNDMLRRISVWQMGNLSGANWNSLWLVAVSAVLLLVLFPRDSKSLNALLLGESEARHLGIHVQRVKQRLILLTAFGVGVSVAAAGLVTFVGLIIPHLVRLLIGPDHRMLIPCSALAGGILLVIADSIARVVVAPAELPTGIITALLGAPFFIGLLIQQRKRV